MKHRKWLILHFILSLICILTGCGGGGGGSNNSDNPDTPIVDGPWLCFTARSSNSTVSTIISDQSGTGGSPIPVLEYSKDGVNWKPFVVADTTVTLAKPGDIVYIRAVSTNDAFSFMDYISPDYRVISFKLDGYGIAASGNVMSLVDKDCTSKIIPCDGCFYGLFDKCYELTTAPELPAKTLTRYCYREMFQSCNALASAPILPATTMEEECYSGIFNKCFALTTAPELPATTLAERCYAAMFSNCINLLSPPALPAINLQNYCYASMFAGCYRMTAAPELQASTLKEGCYYRMFYDCDSLVTAPELPATILADYCYYQMFETCSSLQNIVVHFTDWNDAGNSTKHWTDYLPSGGEFHCRTGLTPIDVPGNGSRNPNSWTVIKDVPEPTP